MTVDPEASPQLREEAAIRLARLADATDRDGHPLAPAARKERQRASTAWRAELSPGALARSTIDAKKSPIA